ncbi:MAG: transglycosylase SLT domain-containing protein [Sulfuriferula sp.]
MHPYTTAALIVAESKGNPYAIGDNTTKRSYIPNSKPEAVALASKLLQAGHRLDMSLTQISSPWLKPWAVSLDQVFDACTNIRLGTYILADHYQRCATSELGEKYALLCTLSRYNTGTSTGGYEYVNRVLATANVCSDLRYFRLLSHNIRLHTMVM